MRTTATGIVAPVAPFPHLAAERRRVETALRSQWTLLPTLAGTLLPWLFFVLVISGPSVTLNLIAYAVVVLAAGYSILFAALPAPRTQTIFLAPVAGVLAISSLTAFWVRLGLPLLASAIVWLTLTVVGIWALARDRKQWAHSGIAYGRTLALVSVAICAAYFPPSAMGNFVQHPDGSYSWRHRDSEHFQAIAASIENTNGAPKSPGTATADLRYHFGGEAAAAAISRFDRLDIGDALGRVTRGVTMWALLLATFAVGTLLSLRATGDKFGGIMSVAGLFSYGSLLSLFTGEIDGVGRGHGATLIAIPDIFVQGAGGPFVHLFTGPSLLFGLIAITAVMGLCLAERERESPLTGRSTICLLLPALAVPMNSVAALCCLGIAGTLVFWGRLKSARSWAAILLLFALFLAAWQIMGFSNAGDAAGAALKPHVAQQWWTVVVAFIIGLGFKIAGFRWIAHPMKDPVAAMVLATVAGMLGFFLLVQLHDGNERYALLFLQSIFSIFAFSRLRPGCWRNAERAETVAEWLRTAIKGMIVLTACGALLGCVDAVTHRHSGIGNFVPKLLFCFLLPAFLAGISWMNGHSRRFASVSSAVLMGVLVVGFLAWVPDWIKYGLGTINTDVTFGPGEVSGLRRLHDLMPQNDLFATNKHAIDLNSRPILNRSYGYSALSERAVLLEGYEARNEDHLPWFPALLHDNDLLFTTTDPQTLRDTAKKWHVRWLVSRPGTDISLPKPLPPWLVPQQDSGDLKIYRVD